VVLLPWTSPGGVLMSTSAQEDVPSWRQRQKERKMREQYEHLLISPHDDLEEAKKMATGTFSEFKKAETVSNDPEGRCKLLQEYIRGWTHPAYAKLQVIRVSHSLMYGNTSVRVSGPGQHFCQVADPPHHHRKNTIFMMVRRRTGELTQHCFHRLCKGRYYSFGTISQDDVRVLFSPLEMLQKKESEMTPAQKGWANSLLQTSQALSVKQTRSKLRHNAKVVGNPVGPTTPSARPPTPLMSPHPITYNDVALGDLDDDPPPLEPPHEKEDSAITVTLPDHAQPQPNVVVLSGSDVRRMRERLRRGPHIALPPPPPRPVEVGEKRPRSDNASHDERPPKRPKMGEAVAGVPRSPPAAHVLSLSALRRAVTSDKPAS
jgi:hypothetical protein